MKAPCRECTLVKEVDTEGRCQECAKHFPTPVPSSPGSFKEWLRAIELSARGEEWKP